jgi:hypothetical protein
MCSSSRDDRKGGKPLPDHIIMFDSTETVVADYFGPKGNQEKGRLFYSAFNGDADRETKEEKVF